MTIEQTIADEIAHVHVEINAASDAFRQRLHDAVCSWQDVHRQNQELQALVNRQRAEIERLQQECTERNAALESYRALACGRIAELEAERSDLRRANRAYAKTLTDIRGALGAVDVPIWWKWRKDRACDRTDGPFQTAAHRRT